MGLSVSKPIWHRLLRKDTKDIIMIGLKDAGKSTVLEHLKGKMKSPILLTTPTQGFELECISNSDFRIYVWDITEGQETRIKDLWKHFYQFTVAVVLQNAVEELNKIVQEELLRGCPILILANKQDKPNPKPTSFILEQLQKYAKEDIKHRTLHVQASNAISGDGVMEGLTWLSSVIPRK